jgi:hypothetical protein
MRRILMIVAGALLAAAAVLAGASASTSAPAEPAKAYGLCVSHSTGYVRALERNTLGKSAVGACHPKTETKITVPSVSGLAPGRLVFKEGLQTKTCTPAAATTRTWTFICTTTSTATTSPSPSPSPSATP